MKDVPGQISLFDLMEPPPKDPYEFSWDADINEIHYRLVNLVAKHRLSIGDEEWSIWDHVPQYGYRMWVDVEGTRGQFTEAFFEDLQEIIDFAKKQKIELSPSMPMFFGDEPAPMYISSTFMDKERRKRK